MRDSESKPILWQFNSTRRKFKRHGRHCLGRKTVPDARRIRVGGRQSLAEVESSTIVASNLPLTREYGSAYSRQSDFDLTHYDRRVNFNESDMLESARSRFYSTVDKNKIHYSISTLHLRKGANKEIST